MPVSKVRRVVQKDARSRSALPLSPLDRVTTWDMTPRQMRDYYAAQLGELGITGQDGANFFALLTPEAIQKTDITIATTGAYNVLFGADTWAQIIQQANTVGALPKAGWPRSGFRVQTTAAIGSGLGIAEGGAVPAAVVPTYLEVTVPPKELAASTAFTRMFMETVGKDDTITWDEHLRVFQANFMNSMDVDIHVHGDTLAGNNLESIDRVTASAAVENNGSWTDGDADLHGIVRDTNAFWDANGLEASGTDRTLSVTLINQLLSGQLPYWEKGASGAFYVTGYTSWARWAELEQPKQRFGEGAFKMGAEGIRETDGGMKFTTWDGIPIVKSSHTVADTIDRIYLLHGADLSLRWAQPVEAVVSQDPFVVQFVKKMALHAIGELVCTKAKSHGSLRDLK